MATHELKTWPEPFQAVTRGEKTHEARFDDRGFAVGDVLMLREWVPKFPDACHWEGSGLPGEYTGRAIGVRVTHITKGQYGLPANLAVMSIRVDPGALPYRPMAPVSYADIVGEP